MAIVRDDWPNIQQVTAELYIAFSYFNKAFFDNDLLEPAITIQSGGKRSTMGWCTLEPIWRDKEGTFRNYEINIAAEYLDIDFYMIMNTLLHEMIHLYCHANGIKDTSRAGAYHNKQFKEECLNRGFYYESTSPDKEKGWAYPKLTDETKLLIDSFRINRDVFIIARSTFDKEQRDEENIDSEDNIPKKSNSLKWICWSCGISVRSTKDVNIMCGDCKETMTLEEM